ncbi:MAG: hypothetical protein J6J36_08190 [Clostridia bacterium]|nr:hypothetical protein [Clostridia bacterium]MBP3708553.1 hypothetical protein [Clostridia bacterium]
MTTMLLIHNKKNNTCVQHFVHEEHEFDMSDYILYNKRSSEIGRTNMYKPNEWFELELNKEDIENIKKTCWYANNKDFGRKHIQKGNTIELITLKWGYNVTIEIEDNKGNTIGAIDLLTNEIKGDISLADVEKDYIFNRNKQLIRLQLDK